MEEDRRRRKRKRSWCVVGWPCCCTTIFVLFALTAGILGIIAFARKPANSDNEIAMLKAEVVDILICKNSTGDGLSIFNTQTFTSYTCVAPCAFPFVEANELWDDANFFSDADPDKIYLPRDGRYVVAGIFTVNVQSLELAGIRATFTIDQYNATSSPPPCQVVAQEGGSEDVETIEATRAMYCEQNYVQTNSSYLQLRYTLDNLGAFDADSISITARVFIRQIK